MKTNSRVAAFLKDEGLDSLICVHDIEKDNPAVQIDVYTWNPANGQKALENLRGAIDDLLEAWGTYKYLRQPLATEDDKKEHPIHYHWPRHIPPELLDDSE
ncbi:hypothetical protein J2X72_003008 [Phyllobacterium sp. 1468]|uniref:hypothetical protein n=1 Tax=Phyllobacterium sp. 1468 TaxID=2817759 RepID=UPI00285CABA5|nr:hypothetical protein [Phyllobacterium sp. 1468]MDR6634208.1 hypothetical protein [Phyllobacterium sp. 1468]